MAQDIWVAPAAGGGAATIADGADTAQGTTTDVAWVSGAGTVVGLLKKIASAGGSAVSVADGSDVAEGLTTDAAVVSDTSGTLSGKIRGLVKIFADMWDSVNHRLNVALPAATVTTLTPPAAITGFALETGGNLAAIKADVDKIPALGQALAAASAPVVLPATQITTLTPPAAITGFALETGGNLAAIKADVDKIPALGQALAAASAPVVLTAAQLTTLTPPAAITGFALETGGNLASIKADVDKIPALGQALAAASTPVVLTAAQLITLTPPAQFGGVVTQPTGTNLHMVADASTAVIGHVIIDTAPVNQEAQGSPLLDVLQMILCELKALRLATVADTCDGGRYKEQDFDPAYFTDILN